jgi:hypothetical protein
MAGLLRLVSESSNRSKSTLHLERRESTLRSDPSSSSRSLIGDARPWNVAAVASTTVRRQSRKALGQDLDRLLGNVVAHNGILPEQRARRNG